MNITNKNWKNKVGTSNRNCQCGSWKNHWIIQSNKEWPNICSRMNCNNKAEVGAHVINENVKGEKIIPLCNACNQLNIKFDLKGGITVINANKFETCEK